MPTLQKPPVSSETQTEFFETISFDELDIIKLHTIDIAKLDYKILKTYADKKKWFERFRKSYRGSLSNASFSAINSMTFIVASHKGKDVGFLGLVDESENFAQVSFDAAYDITLGYVKPAYQSQGVLREMINFAIANHHAKSVTIAYERFDAYRTYYFSMGFTMVSYMEEANCFRIFLTEMKHLLDATCERISVSQPVKRFDM